MKVSKGLILLMAVCLMACHASSPSVGKEDSLQSQNLAGTAWKMDYSMEIHGDTVFNHVPPQWTRIKMFTQNRFSFSGYDFEKNEIAGMGGGKYSLKDSVYLEQIEFHHRSDFNGTEFRGRLYVDSLYLYQEGQVGELLLKERWHRID